MKKETENGSVQLTLTAIAEGTVIVAIPTLRYAGMEIDSSQRSASILIHSLARIFFKCDQAYKFFNDVLQNYDQYLHKYQIHHLLIGGREISCAMLW